ncbi:MAG: peroxide stress protein YaaA [Gammaproteobacteria bacterium]|nr:peroxide stress protein YaaA [Gammaproteobacteria bacterium]
MLVVLSPAKKLDFESPLPAILPHSKPAMLKSASELIEVARSLSHSQLGGLMKISDKLVEENRQRYQNFSTPFTRKNARPAALAFIGDTYLGFDVRSLTADEHKYAQEHLRILSGLYGLLRPFDLIQPYRLEMGIKLKTNKSNNLYEFWGDKITNSLNKSLTATNSKFLLNCASNEYIKAVQSSSLKAELITPVFKQVKNGEARMLGMMAKRARGAMARFVVDNKINKPADLKAFNFDGYRYKASLSNATTYEFHRKA